MALTFERKFYKKGSLIQTISRLDSTIESSCGMYMDILQECVRFNDVEEGRLVHMDLMKKGFEGHLYIETKLMNMYMKCGCMNDAEHVFDKMPVKNVIKWTSVIGGYTQIGDGEKAFKLFKEMLEQDVNPNRVTFLSVLDAFDGAKDLDKGKLVHADIINNDMVTDIMLGTALVNMYGKCDSVQDACHVFNTIETPDLILCTAMINVYTQHGYIEEAIKLFKHMIYQGIEPNEFTFVSILCICSSVMDVKHGKRVHMLLIESGIRIDGFVGAALVSMYAKCGILEHAHSVFDKIKTRDVASWTALITGYAQVGNVKAALLLFEQMQKHGLKSDVVVGNALIGLYAKCGNMDAAKKIFDSMSKKDIISWSTLMSGYVQKGSNMEAIEMYNEMLKLEIYPDKYIITSILTAYANLAYVNKGRHMHSYIAEFDLESDTFVTNALVNMYSKCGCVDDATAVFCKVTEVDVVCWNAMILGFAQCCNGTAAFDLFQDVVKEGLNPDEFTFSGILSACGNLGMLEEAKVVHDYVIKTGFELNNVVCNALVDTYAMCGNVDAAYDVFKKMCTKDVISWSAMIGGWAQHGYGREALSLYGQMQQEDMVPDEFTFSSLLIACSHAGLVEEGWFCLGYFIQDCGIIPTSENYGSMVDLLCRAGCLQEALGFIYSIPGQPHCAIWMSLLAACRSHGNLQLAEHVARYAFDLGPGSAGAYVLLSNIYAVAKNSDVCHKMTDTAGDHLVDLEIANRLIVEIELMDE